MTDRIMIRCCLPNGHHHPAVIEALELDLATAFGGFTRYPMLGIWNNENGTIEREAGCIYEVSFKHETAIERATYMFRVAGRAMGEIWVHIERHEFTAMHAQVNKEKIRS